MEAALSKASKIKLVIFDVDGVLTNGQLIFGDDGQEYKAFHSRDGHGMKMLIHNGIDIAIITGRTSNVVKHRMKNLGIQHVYQGKLDKRPAFIEIMEKLNLKREQVAYVGDDIVDLPVLLQAGFAVTVADGHSLVKQHADWVTPHNGGEGAARDVCEFILKAQDKLEDEFSKYLPKSSA
ncbi:MAG: 3-deoxy-manno-octulosonate-8-phosphatase KdsC [Gammaproteobacteria bacterium]|nr:3-deoxy-manno-octulosonate-8-phosphatase KdsC [Gammaproteobacteria bacterium]